MNKENKVIKIIDKHTVFIDVNHKEHSVSINQPLYIYEEGPEIEDLDGNKLGKYDFIKATVYVKEIYPKFIVAKHQVKNVENTSLSTLTSMFNNQSFTNIPLSLDEKEIDYIQPKTQKIKLGDKVKFHKN